MPVLGIIASQMSGHLFAPSGAYDSIATTTVGGGEQHLSLLVLFLPLIRIYRLEALLEQQQLVLIL
jgi:hypothetical protein